MKHNLLLIIYAFLAVLTGCTNQYGAFYKSINWAPSILSTDGCPQLSGIYTRDGRFLGDVIPMPSRNIDAPNKKKDSLNPRAIIRNSLPYPVHMNPDGYPKAEERYPDTNRIREARKAYSKELAVFFKSLTMRIEQSTTELIITNEANGVIYDQIEFDIQQPGVGCSNNVLYIRSSFVSGGSEGGGGIASATEKRIRILSTGDIRVDKTYQSWEFSSWTGRGNQLSSEHKIITLRPLGSE